MHPFLFLSAKSRMATRKLMRKGGRMLVGYKLITVGINTFLLGGASGWLLIRREEIVQFFIPFLLLFVLWACCLEDVTKNL